MNQSMIPIRNKVCRISSRLHLAVFWKFQTRLNQPLLLASIGSSPRISNRASFCCVSIVVGNPSGFRTGRRKFPRDQIGSRSLLLSSTSSSSSLLSSDAFVPVTQNTNNNNLPGKLIDFQVASKIEGEESNIVTIELYPGDLLRAEAGSMIYMTEGVVMDTKLNGASSAFSRFLTGQNLFLTDFYYDRTEGKGTICLGTDFPSKILRFALEDHPGSTLVCQRGAYLASNATVSIETEFTKSFTAGFFGGQGFILQKLSGTGDVLVKGYGTTKKLQLDVGETLRVTSGSIIAFETTVSYDVSMMPGITNAMFGGEGLFITTLTGPGNVWLQGMPPDRMISEIARRVPSGSPIGFGIPLGGGGGGGSGGDVDVDGGTGDSAGVTSEDSVAGIGSGTAGGESVGDGSIDPTVTSDAAIQADRSATIASSGIESESPSALFGDAAVADDDSNNNNRRLTDEFNNLSADVDDDDTNSFATSTTSSSSQETYVDDQAFEDYASSSINDDSSTGVKDGELFNDDGSEFGGSDTTPIEIDPTSESGSSSIFRTLWDLFTGNDN